MTTLTVEGEQLRVEFRHRSKFTRTPGVTRKAPWSAKTICVIIHDKFVAIGESICMPEDNFCKAEGRDSAFGRAVQDCGPLRKIERAVFDAYEAAKPPAMVPFGTGPKILTALEKNALREAGASVRGSRRRRRAGDDKAAS